MNTYAKLFLATGIPFGIVMGLLTAIVTDLETGLIEGVRLGVMYGGLMSVVLGTIQMASDRQVTSKYSRDDSYNMGSNTLTSSSAVNKVNIQNLLEGVHFVRRIEVPLTYSETFDLCIASVNALKKAKIETRDKMRGLVIARTGVSFKGMGEDITLNVKVVNDNTTKIEVSSKPVLRTTLADLGKNRENVELITDFIRSALHS
jgi:hypothetical protein